MTELRICRGLPACGKSTFARAYVAEDPKTRARVNKDDLRRLLHDGVYLGRDTENTVNMIRDNMIRSLLRKGISVVSDDTNLPQPVARDLARIGREAGAKILVEDMTHVPRETCIERDAVREHKVGVEVIDRMYNKFIAGKKLPLPFPEDGPEKDLLPFIPYEADPNLPKAWMVDIDGTLAHMAGRSPYEWHRVGEDAVNIAVHDVINRLASFPDTMIILMSGRDAVCRPETTKWLSDNDVPWKLLVMRPEGDMRKDSIVKHELFWEYVAPHYAVQGVFDDRDQVVRMWRQIGLPCFQVADGSF